MRIAKTVAAIAFLGGLAGNAWATKLEDQFRILAEIRTTAVFLCPDIPVNSRANATKQENWSETNIDRLNVLKSIRGSKTLVERRATEGVLQAQLADLLKSNATCRLAVLKLLQGALLPGAAPNLKPNVPVKAPPPARSTGLRKAAVDKHSPILRVFPKNNLTSRDVAALATLLPNYSVMVGRSSIEPTVGADTLFVNRDKITIAEVVTVLRAMKRIGVPVKAVMQTPVGGRREIQVGTVAAIGKTYTDQSPLFESASYLDIEALSHLSGADFWKAAANGYELCMDDGGMVGCRLDSDGRPTIL